MRTTLTTTRAASVMPEVSSENTSSIWFVIRLLPHHERRDRLPCRRELYSDGWGAFAASTERRTRSASDRGRTSRHLRQGRKQTLRQPPRSETNRPRIG